MSSSGGPPQHWPIRRGSDLYLSNRFWLSIKFRNNTFLDKMVQYDIIIINPRCGRIILEPNQTWELLLTNGKWKYMLLHPDCQKLDLLNLTLWCHFPSRTVVDHQGLRSSQDDRWYRGWCCWIRWWWWWPKDDDEPMP